MKYSSDISFPKHRAPKAHFKFIRNIGGVGYRTDILVGFTADYAAIVHEDMTKKHGADFNIKHADEIVAAEGTKRGTAKGGMFLRGEDQQAKFLDQNHYHNRNL